MRPDIRPGGTFPDYSLPDHTGTERTLSELSDPGRTVQQDLDIAEYTDPEHNPMVPHTLVLKPGLIIHSVYNGDDTTAKRPAP